MMRFKSFEILKSLVSKPALGLALVAMLTGCFKPGKHDAGGGSATFMVEELKGAVAVTQNMPQFSIPQAHDLNFSICTKNMRSNDPIKGHKFSLEGAARPQDLVSGDDGCLRWSERISFNFLGDEKFVAFKRTITAHGMESGSRTVRFAVNPWDEKKAVVDLTDERNKIDQEKLVDESLAAQALQAKGQHRPLLIDSVAIRNRSGGQSRGGGFNRVLSVWFKSYIQRTDINGAPVDYQLNEAKLKLKATLLMSTREAGQEDRTAVWSTSQAVPVSLQENGIFKVELPVSVHSGDLSKSYLLALQAATDGGPEGLVPYEAVYTIGTYNDLAGGDAFHVDLAGSNFAGTFRYDKVTSFGAELESQGGPGGNTGSGSSAETPAASGHLRPGQGKGGSPAQPGKSSVTQQTEIIDVTESGHLVSRMVDTKQEKPVSDQAKNGPIYVTSMPSLVKFYEDPGHRAFDSRSHFSVQFCFKDSSNNNQLLAGAEFEVTKADGKKENVRTSSNPDASLGCLGYEEAFEFNWFDADKYLVFRAKFKHKRSGQEIERFYAVNPYLDFFTFRDLGSKDDPWSYRENRLNVYHFNIRDVVPSRAFIDGAAHGTPKNRRFRVDRYLNLETIVPVSFTLEVKVAREGGTFNASRTPAVPLPAGPVLVKAVLYNRVTNAAGQVVETIAPFEWGGRKGYQIIPFYGGAIRAEFEVPVHTLEMMRARSRIVLQVLPIDLRKIPSDPVELKKKADAMSDEDLETLVAPLGNSIFPTFVAGFRIQEGTGYTFVPSDLLQGKIPAPWDSFMSHPPSAEELAEIEPLLNVSVDNLLEKARQQDRDYQLRMYEQQKLTNVTKSIYADFVSLKNEAQVLAGNPGASAGNTFLPQTNAAEPLLLTLNQPLPRPNTRVNPRLPIDLSPYDFKDSFRVLNLIDIVRGTKQIDRPLAAHLCSAYMNYFLPRATGVNIALPQRADRALAPNLSSAPGKAESLVSRLKNAALKFHGGPFGQAGRSQEVKTEGPFGSEELRNSWYTRCLEAVDANGPEAVFSIDRTLRVSELDHAVRAKDNIGTCEASFGINAGVSYGQGTSESSGYSLSWDPLSMFGHGLDTVGRAIEVIGLRYTGAIPGMLGVGFNIGYSKSDSVSTGRDSSWGQNVGMDMQQTELRLHLTDYEHCATIRMTPEFWKLRGQALEQLSQGLSEEQVKALLMSTARGVFICEGQRPAEHGPDGKPQLKPIDIYEHYYAFSQSGLSGLRGDQNDPKNLPWLTQLRGVRDYATFMKIVADEKSLASARKELNVLNLPFERFSQAYAAYGKLNPTLPGFYSYNPAKQRDPNVICQ